MTTALPFRPFPATSAAMNGPTDSQQPGTRSAFYAQRTRPYAQETVFSLFPDRLVMEKGRHAESIALSDIVMVRLLYKPRNMTNEGYAARIVRRQGRSLMLTNLSWKSLMDMEHNDREYRTFVEAMIAAVHRANSAVALQAGMPRLLHGLTALAGLSVVVALVIITAEAIRNLGKAIALVSGLFAIYLGWWALRYVMRNRPRSFQPGFIPDDVLPKIPAVRP